jgi:hypothetical protein
MTTPETMRRFTGELTTAQKPQETLGRKFKFQKKPKIQIKPPQMFAADKNHRKCYYQLFCGGLEPPVITRFIFYFFYLFKVQNIFSLYSFSLPSLYNFSSFLFSFLQKKILSIHIMSSFSLNFYYSFIYFLEQCYIMRKKFSRILHECLFLLGKFTWLPFYHILSLLVYFLLKGKRRCGVSNRLHCPTTCIAPSQFL